MLFLGIRRAVMLPRISTLGIAVRWRELPGQFPWWRGLVRRCQAGRDLLLQPLYGWYEHRLLGEVRRQPPPRHIGIILDGNRRFGQRAGMADPLAIYRRGAEKLDDVLDWCGELAIPTVTLWVCSTENLGRSAEQVAVILQALEEKLRSLVRDPQIHSNRVRVQAIGRLDLLPPSTRAAIRAAADATAGYEAMVLTVAVAYGGREEIVDAVRALLTDMDARGLSLRDAIGDVTPEAISRHLYLCGAAEPELIIRTSGEVRFSGFLLWQSTYSEYYFSDVLWPEFRRLDFLRAVRAFQQRKRRFGR